MREIEDDEVSHIDEDENDENEVYDEYVRCVNELNNNESSKAIDYVQPESGGGHFSIGEKSRWDLLNLNPNTRINFDVGENSDSTELRSLQSSDDEGENEVEVYPKFQRPADRSTIEFFVGMLFSSVAELRQAVYDYSIHNHRNIKIIKSDTNRIRAKCSDGCGWLLYGAKLSNAFSVQVKTYYPEHTCSRTYHNSNMSANWIAENMLETVRAQPDIMTKNLQAQVEAKYGVSCSKTKAFRARDMAIKITQGDHIEQYKHIRDYCDEILRSNPGSTCKIKCGLEDSVEGSDPIARFERLYFCLEASKQGFVIGCRPVIGIDGCFLKGPCGGILLTAVGKDPNECLFPIAMAVVESENKDSWSWFLELLVEDIGMQHIRKCTFISDQQKGLIQALQELLPDIEHRFCVRHLYSNFQKQHRGILLKQLMWKAAKATTEQSWARMMEQIKTVSEAAYSYLMKIDTKVWCRHAFRINSKCASLTNNMSESFNSAILDAREKPIITMLESIRISWMIKYQNNRENASKWSGALCPKTRAKLENAKKKVNDWICRFSGAGKFEISSPDRQYSVDLNEHTCSCREWEITGIPCVHAISAIFHKGADPANYVNSYYSIAAYKRCYSKIIHPVNGKELWPVTGLNSPLPPLVRKRIGRPKKLRRLEEGEKRGKGASVKLGKKGTIMKCTKCNQCGHNRRTCKVNTVVNEGQRASQGGERGTTRAQSELHSYLTNLTSTQNSVCGPSDGN